MNYALLRISINVIIINSKNDNEYKSDKQPNYIIVITKFIANIKKVYIYMNLVIIQDCKMFK